MLHYMHVNIGLFCYSINLTERLEGVGGGRGLELKEQWCASFIVYESVHRNYEAVQINTIFLAEFIHLPFLSL